MERWLRFFRGRATPGRLHKVTSRGGSFRRRCFPIVSTMSDVLIALGLVFAIEGLVFAAFPAAVKRAMIHVMETPDEALRIVGLVSAVIGIALIWLVRG